MTLHLPPIEETKWVAPENLLNRELSWLRFNSRVLELAEDDGLPLLERVKYLAIVGANQDEFFMKRIGGLKLRGRLAPDELSPDGLTCSRQVTLCRKMIADMAVRQETCFLQTIIPALRDQGVFFASWEDLDEGAKAWCTDYYDKNIEPVLTPLTVDASHPFPFISNLSLSVSVSIRLRQGTPTRFVRIKVPTNRSRWIRLPDGVTYIPLEQVIAKNIRDLFPGEDLSIVHFFRVTRSIVVDSGDYQDDLYEDLEDDRPGQLRAEIADHLRERRFAPAVRLGVDEPMPDDLRRWLLDQLRLTNEDLYVHKGPLGLCDLMHLAELNRPDLKFKAWRPPVHPRLRCLKTEPNSMPEPSIFTVVRHRDLLVHHPFDDFDSSVLHFIRAASEDPRVLAIKQTLYRTASDSPIVHALVRAAETGKQVAVLVELKARLDELQNMKWAQVLESAGAHVTYGVEDLKTHTKLILVVREEDNGLRRYAHIGTGNYHPGTAKHYTDVGLLTADPIVCDEVAHLFNTLTAYSHYQGYDKLLVAPYSMRRRFIKLIERETAHALAGRPAQIRAKMNQLEDTSIIGKLYEASQAGVRIHLVVRGFCTLRPGVPGLSDNIVVTSVLGRYLEHSRIFIFHNDGKPEYFIGSADWMSRNLRQRVEAVVKVEDDRSKAELENSIKIYMEDNVTAWLMDGDGTYARRRPLDNEPSRPSQEILMQLHAAGVDKR